MAELVGQRGASKMLRFSQGGRSGVEVAYVKSRGVLRIGGWYDSFVGIEGEEISLRDFLFQLGITANDVVRALRA